MPNQRALRSGGESLLPEERLRKRADFQRCYERGRRRHGPLATLFYLQRLQGEGPARLGITVTRKVGGAVVRQRIKRRIREIFRRWDLRRSLPALDLVVHVKPAARAADFAALETELGRLLRPLVTRPHQAGRVGPPPGF